MAAIWWERERFSGRGHARHLCRDCAKLDQADLEYRQHIRNIERTLDWDGRIRWRHPHQPGTGPSAVLTKLRRLSNHSP